jgi:hypothetical protein
LTINAGNDIVFEGGTGSNSFAQANAGAGGSLTLRAGNDIRLISTPGGPVTVNAFNGATLTMIAPEQVWGGFVRSDGGPGGGTVQLGGAISASVAPRFALASGQDFGLGVVPGSGPSSYLSTTQPLYVGTAGTGRIDLRGSVTATDIGLYSSESIRVDATVTATKSGTALRVVAGQSFINNVEGSALVVPTGRFLLYVDHLDSIVGPTPGPTNFSLYNRTHLTHPPSSLAGFTGNRIIYAERPTLTLTGETLSKQFGTSATPGFKVAGLLSGDTLGTALTAPPVVTSAGAPASAAVGAYPTMVEATASVQGYALSRIDGTLTVVPPTATVPNAAVPSDLIRDFLRGVPPNTPGDATFRTTVLLAPPVLEGPFVLTYSLGSVTQQAPAANALAPAGFVPAAGVVAESAQEGGLPACGGPINAGPLSTGCSPTIQVESFWETRRAVAQ